MATVLQPIVNELNTVLVQLRTELRGLQTDADGAGIAIKVSLKTGCRAWLIASAIKTDTFTREILQLAIRETSGFEVLLEQSAPGQPIFNTLETTTNRCLLQNMRLDFTNQQARYQQRNINQQRAQYLRSNIAKHK